MQKQEVERWVGSVVHHYSETPQRSVFFPNYAVFLPAEYKVESIQAPKVSWQQDPRLQDSSSEEDEEEQEEDEEQTSATLTTAE